MQRSFFIDFECFDVFSDKELYGLPGGEQVDGLPPAASTDRSRLDPRQLRNYSEILGRFFEKVEFLTH